MCHVCHVTMWHVMCYVCHVTCHDLYMSCVSCDMSCVMYVMCYVCHVLCMSCVMYVMCYICHLDVCHSNVFYHRLLTIIGRTIDVVFSRFRSFFSFTKTLRQRLKWVTRMLPLFLLIKCCLRRTHIGFCIRVFVNETSPKFWKDDI